MPGALPQQEQLAELVELAEPVQLGALVPTVVHLPELAIAEQPVQQQGAVVQIAG